MFEFFVVVSLFAVWLLLIHSRIRYGCIPYISSLFYSKVLKRQYSIFKLRYFITLFSCLFFMFFLSPKTFSNELKKIVRKALFFSVNIPPVSSGLFYGTSIHQEVYGVTWLHRKLILARCYIKLQLWDSIGF